MFKIEERPARVGKRDGLARFQEALGRIPAGGRAEVWFRLPIQLGDMIMALPSLFTVKNAWQQLAQARGVRLDCVITGRRSAALFRESVPQVFAACHLDDEFPPSRSPLQLRRHWGPCPPIAVVNYSKSDRLKLAAWLAGVPVRAGIGDGSANWSYHFSHPFMSYDAVGHRVFRYLPLTRWLAGPETNHQQERLDSARFGGRSVLDQLRTLGWDGRPYVVFGVFPLPPFPERRWMPLEAPWVHLAELARAAGVTPVLVGGPEQREALAPIARASGALDLSGRTDLPQLLALLDLAYGTISVDTGIAHLAAATGRPTVVIFSHGQEFWDFPCGPKVISLRGNPAFEPLYPVSPRFPDDVVRPWTAATSSIPAERAWSVLNALAAEP